MFAAEIHKLIIAYRRDKKVFQRNQMFDLIQIMKDREYKIDIIYENLILFNKKIESQEDV